MKKTLHFLKNLIIFTYILVIIFVTICLLSYNDYKVTEFGDSTLVPVIDKDLEPDYTVGDLLIINKNRLAEVNIGDTVFFYRTYMGETTINYATVTNLERVTDTETTFTIEGDYQFSSSYFIGKASTATVIPVIGRILGILESKFGFLFLGVFPSLIVFLYTAYTLFIEVKEGDEEEIEETKPKKNNKKEEQENKENNEGKNINTENIKPDKEIVEEKVTEETKTSEKEIETKKENVEEIKKEKIEENKQEKIKEDKVEVVQEVKQEQIVEDKKEVENKIEETKNKEQEKNENKKKELTEEQKKALIEAKMKTMTEEQKKALIEAKLKTMTDEQKRALIEAKRKKIEAEKSKK